MKCKHLDYSVIGIHAYDGCVAEPGSDECNPPSHAGVRYRERCTCGAERDVNSNGRGLGREEYGRWESAKETDNAKA